MERDIEILEERIRVDRLLRSKNESMWNDFDRFCESECVATENLINRVKELEQIEAEHQKENGELRIRNDELNNAIGKEYQLGYGQGEYEVNEYWKSRIREIRDKAEVMDYYTLVNVIDDLNKLLEDK